MYDYSDYSDFDPKRHDPTATATPPAPAPATWKIDTHASTAQPAHLAGPASRIVDLNTGATIQPNPAFRVTDEEAGRILQQAQDERRWEDALDTALAQVRETMIRKHRDYGPGNISMSGEVGVVVRLGDKWARLKQLVIGAKTPQNEAIDDTWLDIVGYGIIGMMLRDSDGWNLPMRNP